MFVYNDNMFYNDDFFKRMKTILRCCLDIEVDVDLEASFYSSCIKVAPYSFNSMYTRKRVKN